jgi:hypothetical protein
VGLGRGKALLITGNMHARELAGTEFCIYLAYNLAAAYKAGEDLVLGGKVVPIARIRFLVENMTLILIPCVNPDGREHVWGGRLRGDFERILWRGNRNYWVGYAPAGETRACYGVDLNRNQDFVWDHLRHFGPGERVQTTNLQCDRSQVFRGLMATSEQEAKNLVWVMDQNPNIAGYLDIHGSHGAIVHPWGHDRIQSEDSSMNFQNSAFDGQRGPHTYPYREYMPASDLRRFQFLAGAFRDGLAEARGMNYDVMPAVELAPSVQYVGGTSYTTFRPTSGASDDYAYSRHFVDSSLSKIFAFTVEFGAPLDSESLETQVSSFQPEGLEQALITGDLIAGTLDLFYELRPGINISGCLPMMMLLATTVGTALTCLGFWLLG